MVSLGCPGLPPLGVGVLDGEVAEEGRQEGEDHYQEDPVDVGHLATLQHTHKEGQGSFLPDLLGSNWLEDLNRIKDQWLKELS